MKDSAKKTAALIVAGLGDEEGAEKAEAPKLDSLMEELAIALRSNDYAGAAQAFKAASGVCGSEDHEEESGEL